MQEEADERCQIAREEAIAAADKEKMMLRDEIEVLRETASRAVKAESALAKARKGLDEAADLHSQRQIHERKARELMKRLVSLRSV